VPPVFASFYVPVFFGGGGGVSSPQFETWNNLEQQFMNAMFQQYQQQGLNVKPTDKKQLNNLPVYICDKNDEYQRHFGDCDKECAVCLCESEDKDRLLNLPCAHTFHESCILPWLEKHNSCPVCRYELSTSDPVQERLREQRMIEQYGVQALQIMQIAMSIQRLYSDLQIWKQSEHKSVSQLNAINAELTQNMYSLDAIIIPDEEELQQMNRKTTAWDWNRIRQLRKQLVLRIQFLQENIDSIHQCQTCL
jgi:hypothetical protein